MERQFSGNLFGNYGQPPEVALFSVRNGIREMPLPFPGPFSQDRVNMLDAGWNAE